MALKHYATSKLSKITQATYIAAVISAIFGIVRDYVVLNVSDGSKEFYDLLYIGSLCSVFAINSILLDLKPPTVRFIACLSIVSLGLLIVGWFWRPNYFNWSPAYFIAICSVVIMWIFGAVASRAQMSAGFAFTARFRDALFSAAMALQLILGISTILAFVFGVLISTVWIFWITRPQWGKLFLHRPVKQKLPHLFRTIILLNVGTATMLLWALHFNDSKFFFFGYTSTAIIRISMYIFQALSIGFIVISTNMPTLHPILSQWSLVFSAAFFGCGVFASWISSGVALLVMPFAVACAQYFVIIYLHHKNSQENLI